MRQRAMIAAALVCEPALLIADEPTTALDVTVQAQILDCCSTCATPPPSSLITHDLGVVAEICDTHAAMYAGRVVEGARWMPATARCIPTRPGFSLAAALERRRSRGSPPSPAVCRRPHACRAAAASSRAAAISEPA